MTDQTGTSSALVLEVLNASTNVVVDGCAGLPQLVSGNALDGSYSYTCNMPSTIPPGAYGIVLKVSDILGHDDLASRVLFTVPDVFPPLVQGLSATPNPPARGGTMTLDWELVDQTGVASTSIVSVASEATGTSLGACTGPGTRVSGTPLDGFYRLTCTIPALAPGGNYDVVVQQADSFGNSAIGQPHFTFSIPVDNNPPLIQGFTSTPFPETRGGQVTLSWNLSDQTAVASSSIVSITNETTHLSLGACTGPASLTSGTTVSGTWSLTCTIPAFAPGGVYDAVVQQADVFGNSYTGSPSAALQIPLDPNPPLVAQATFSPSSAVKPGAPITITWELTDQTGVASGAIASFTNDSTHAPLGACTGPGTLVSGTAVDAFYSLSCTIPASAPLGYYDLSFTSVDVFGNSNTTPPTLSFQVK
jgi:hypothetical protein